MRYRTTHAAIWSAVEIASRYGVQIVVTIVLARLLSPSDFGLIAMLLVFTNIGALLADAGFGSALIQRQNTNFDDETTAFCLSSVIGFFAAVVMYACAEPIARFYHQPPLIDLTRTIAWMLPLGALGAVPDALLTKRLDFKSRARAQVVASLLSGALAIGMAWRGSGVWSLVAQALTASGLRSLMLWIFSRWRPRGRPSATSFRNLFGFGGFMLLSGLLNTLSVRIQALVIGRLFDAGTLGYFTLAQNASGMPTNLIGAVLGRVGLPVFSELSHEKMRLRTALRRALDVSLFLFVPCMVGLAVVARPLIELVYGMRWTPATPMLALLALSGSLWPFHVLNLTALSAQGRSDRFFRLEIFKNAITVVATLVAARWGAVAIAAAVLATGICAAGVNTWYSHKMLGYGLYAQLRDQRVTFLLTGLAALPAWAVLHWTAPRPLHTLTAIVTALVVYLGLAVWMRCPGWIQLRQILLGILTSGISISRARNSQ
jgi:O-antigen/teichoic acid export membrane protein